ncbi:MAG: hypothetical protein K6F72_01090 [Bacteroidales bacterium]|nr:hypothetical protein [Bacteroidales bacterium]
MKHVLFLFSVLLLAPAEAFAQTWVWPMAGHKAGDNIISPPNSLVGTEFNCCDIYIGGEEDDVVISPVSGTVTSVGVSYILNIGYEMGYKTDDDKTWDENIRQINPSDDVVRRYLSGCITIKIADGRKVSLTGLRGNRCFKMGQQVSAGDTLGRLAWAYKGVQKPSLIVSASLPSTIAADPLAPFGLESNFHLEIRTREDPLPVEQMREDLTVLEQAMLELYPSLNERMSDEEFHNLMDSLRQSVTAPTPLFTALPLIKFTHLLHDSHLALMADRFEAKQKDIYVPMLFYMMVDDTLRVVLAEKRYKDYVGRVVASVDGMSPQEYMERGKQYIPLYDHGVESKFAEELSFISHLAPYMYFDSSANSKSHVVFADGEVLDIPFKQYPFRFSDNSALFKRLIRWRKLNTLYDHPDSVYSTRQLNDSTAYLSIRTFDMGETQLNHILQWIGDCQSANMIIDVRSNPGGAPKVLDRLLACFAQQPMNRQRGSHLFVNKKGPFDNEKYIENLVRGQDVFPNYVQVEGKPGYYCFDSTKTSACIMPDSTHQYRGRVYVLTNGNSRSCATVFPSVLVRNRRGVSVGRETGSAYHYLTALQTANVCLPNSLLVVSIPMEKVVFDTTVCARTPWGRGLLPDYELPLTYREVTMGADGETDVMLEYALQLIADGKYLSEEDPFAEIDAPQTSGRHWLWLAAILGGAVVAMVVVLALRRHSLLKRYGA